MKKLFIISAMAMSGLIYNTANAQISLHFGLRFRPRVVVYAHAPAVVEQAPVYAQAAPVYDQSQAVYNDSNDDYYYLPDVDAYYDVNDQCYYYNDGTNWISAAYLPGAYSNYDWRNAPRYEIRASRPYLHDDVYRSRYNGHQVSDFAHNNYNNHSNNGYANRDNSGNNQHFDNWGQGRNNQPSNQNSYQRKDSRVETEHFAQNNHQRESENNRMTR
jgi:hypothetical protein